MAAVLVLAHEERLYDSHRQKIIRGFMNVNEETSGFITASVGVIAIAALVATLNIIFVVVP